MNRTTLLIIVASSMCTGCASSRVAETRSDTGLSVQARWDPMVDSKYGLADQAQGLALVVAPQPAIPERHYESADFEALLPTRGQAVGSVWEVDVEAVLPFLRQFHPSVTEKLHHKMGWEGARACLLGRDGAVEEVLLRVHADFELEQDVWFTPAQFEGRLSIDRDTGQVEYFRLALPSRNTNVDVNADGAADIGYVPRMELVGGSHNRAAGGRRLELDDARHRLALSFYEFLEIDWLPLDEALQQAETRSLPLHIVVLFGSLDDESC